MASSNTPIVTTPKKRKLEQSSSVTAPPKKMARYNRHISAQSVSAIFPHGELDVGKFVKAREYEIKALEDALQRSKHSDRTRAFQEVPRSMRRRTGSHNVKRVPKRMRARAKREMAEDKTPPKTKKNIPRSLRFRMETIKKLQSVTRKIRIAKTENKGKTLDEMDVEKPAGNGEDALLTAIKSRKPKVKKAVLREPPVPKARFKKRQIDKTWLPTHLWHAKRAHMTSPKEPLWKFAIPLTPTEKCYRSTHRAATARGAVAWDTSYMSTIELQGDEKSIIGLLKAMGVGNGPADQHIWRKPGDGWRSGSRGWNGWLYKRQEFPLGAISQATVIWCPEDLTHESTNTRRTVFVRCHPGAFLQVWEEIVRLSKVQKPSISVSDLRFEIGSIQLTGPHATESLVGILHPFSDSTNGGDMLSSIWKTLGQLSAPSFLPKNFVLGLEVIDPRLKYPPRKLQFPKDNAARLLDICNDWPIAQSPIQSSFFDRTKRQTATSSLPTQKAINSRKGAAPPGAYPKPLSSDPKIPVLLLAEQGGGSNKGSWTLLLPWKCVAAVWSPLVHFPLSSGGNVRFGGIQESRQIAFAAGQPWFPADFPGTVAGKAWETRETAKVKSEWAKRPKGRRVEFENIDLGNNRKGEIGDGCACDWKRLVRGPPDGDETMQDVGVVHHPDELTQLPTNLALKALIEGSDQSFPDTSLVTVRITMITAGVPQTRARIYRLPAKNDKLGLQWISQMSNKTSKAANALAKPGDKNYPIVPDERDLIGFITTGNFNLAEGSGTGIGNMQFSKIQPLFAQDGSNTGQRATIKHLCVIRNAGQTVGRLARWELA